MTALEFFTDRLKATPPDSPHITMLLTACAIATEHPEMAIHEVCTEMGKVFWEREGVDIKKDGDYTPDEFEIIQNVIRREYDRS